MNSSTWISQKLEKVADLKNGKARPKNEGVIPIYGGNGVLGYADDYNVQGETIIIGRVGAYCGATYFENKPCWISDNALYAKAKDDNDGLFLYYLLKQKNLNQFAGGSSHPLLTQGRLNDLEVAIPKPDVQRRIAKILSSLDQKIELNRQTNQTLEAIAQAIFKEWFVDFNFPGATGELVESALGMMPKGWRVGKLGDVLDVKGGTTPSTKVAEYWDGENYWATPKDLSNLQTPVLLTTERKITDKGVKQISSGVLPIGTLLLSSRAPIGYLAITTIPVSINQGFIAINGTVLSNIFLLYWLKQNMETVVARANGSTFLEISKTAFKQIELIIPTEEVASAFSKIAKNLFENIKNNEQQTQTLVQLRDSLLPKLMKGEIKI